MVVTSRLPEAEHFLGPHPRPVDSPPLAHDLAAAADELGAVDALLATYREQESSRESLQRARDAERERFVREAGHALEYIVKPAFSAVVHRLNHDGGGGLITERAANGPRGQRITLWLSPEGPLPDAPRVDRFPYIQIDVDVPARVFGVWEGDMWNRRGASRTTRPFTLETLTTDEVTKRAIGVLRRVVALDAPPVEPEQ